jgi:hypothetical protein
MASTLVQPANSAAASPANGASAGAGSSSPPSPQAVMNISKTLFELDDKWKQAVCVFCGSADGNSPVYKVSSDSTRQKA